MDALLVALIGISLVLAAPFWIVLTLFARTRRLRADVEGLRARLHELETRGARIDSVAEPVVREQPTIIVTRPIERPIERSPEPGAAIREELPRPPSEAPTPQRDAPRAESLESRIGGRWLLNIGTAAIVIGVAYFEKLAIDNRWIGETARVIQGGVLGAILILAGRQFARRGYALYGQMMAGGGVAIFYVSTYAAFNYYHLIDRPLAFGLMVAITAVGALLADRHASQGLAVLAVGGGFMTPFLLPGTADAQTALFTYVAILIAGTVFLARRRAWPLLHIVSYLFTLLTLAAWSDRFYAPAKYLPTELYITVYCAMFVAIAAACRRLEDDFARFASWFLWTAPLAYYGASLAILADHPIALLVWLIALALVAGVLSERTSTGAGLVVWLAAALPLLAWTQEHSGGSWLAPGLAAVAATYGIALAAQLRSATAERQLRALDIVWMHANALLMFAGAYFMLERTHLALAGPIGWAFAGGQGLLAAAFWRQQRDRAIHFVALGFTVLSVAIALQFDGPALTVGWAAEGAVVITLGLYQRRDWLRAGGTLLFAIAILRALDLLLSPTPANHVIFLNPRAASAMLIVALSYALAWLHRRADATATRAFAVGATIVAAQVVSLVLLTTEIHAYWAVRGGGVARELMVSVTWAVYATVLIVVGLQRRYAIIRYFAIGLFGITIVKVFFGDLSELERIYRVMSVIGLGITLLLTSYLYQRMRGAGLGNGPTE